MAQLYEQLNCRFDFPIRCAGIAYIKFVSFNTKVTEIFNFVSIAVRDFAPHHDHHHCHHLFRIIPCHFFHEYSSLQSSSTPGKFNNFTIVLANILSYVLPFIIFIQFTKNMLQTNVLLAASVFPNIYDYFLSNFLRF